MTDIKTLRYGCHVLVGSNYPTFSVPKHYAKVTHIYHDTIECIDFADSLDPDEYNASEIDGIVLADIIPILEKNGFYKSKLSNTRYIKTNDLTHDRIVVNVNINGSCTCHGQELVERSGVKYLHQLEACIADAGINFEFSLV